MSAKFFYSFEIDFLQSRLISIRDDYYYEHYLDNLRRIHEVRILSKDSDNILFSIIKSTSGRFHVEGPVQEFSTNDIQDLCTFILDRVEY